MGASRPSFGVAKPMKGGPGAKASDADAEVSGGDQFPPIEALADVGTEAWAIGVVEPGRGVRFEP